MIGRHFYPLNSTVHAEKERWPVQFVDCFIPLSRRYQPWCLLCQAGTFGSHLHRQARVVPRVAKPQYPINYSPTSKGR